MNNNKPHGNTGNQHAKRDGETATSHLHIRVFPSHKTSWVRQANLERKKLATWVIETLNNAVNKD